MVAHTVQDEMQVLKDDVAKLRSDVADLVGMLKDLGLSKVNETRENLGEELREQREKLRAEFNRAKERGKSAVDEVGQQVGMHPLGSLLTAFGIGYIIARLSGGRN